jgi:hypothetical protein
MIQLKHFLEDTINVEYYSKELDRVGFITTAPDKYSLHGSYPYNKHLILTDEVLENSEFVTKYPDDKILSVYAVRDYYSHLDFWNKMLSWSTNLNFWKGTTKEIDQTWNEGKLDKLYGKISKLNLDYIINIAPPEFVLWAIKQKFENNDTLNKKEMQTYIIDEENEYKHKLSALSKNVIRLLSYQNSEGNFPKAEKDNYSLIKFLGELLNTKNDKLASKHKLYSNKFSINSKPNRECIQGVSETRNISKEEVTKVMQNFYDPLNRILGYALKNDWESMKQDFKAQRSVRLLGHVITTNITKMERPTIPYTK